jgi:hypothetical protein
MDYNNRNSASCCKVENGTVCKSAQYLIHNEFSILIFIPVVISFRFTNKL